MPGSFSSNARINPRATDYRLPPSSIFTELRRCGRLEHPSSGNQRTAVASTRRPRLELLAAKAPPAVGRRDCGHDDPQRRTEGQVEDQVGYPYHRQSEQDKPADDARQVHEHRHQHALGTVVDLHHEHPVGQQNGEDGHGQVERRWDSPTGDSHVERQVQPHHGRPTISPVASTPCRLRSS